VSFKITAVIEDVPANSHFRPTVLVSMSTYASAFPIYFTDWDLINFPTYFKLKKGVSPIQVEHYLNNLSKKHIRREDFQGTKDWVSMRLVPITDIHLHSRVKEEKAQAEVIYIFAVIAFLILFVACINYINLATALSVERAKEVGIRKVVGSHKSQLVWQFLTESVLLSLLAFVISLSLTEVFLPQFNQLADKQLALNYTSQPQIILILLTIILFTGLISGIYPAGILARFNPTQVLKGRFSHSSKGNVLRKGLVVFQFSISILMIISTWIVFQQMQYVRDRDLGFAPTQTVALRLSNQSSRKKYPIIKRALLDIPGIVAVTGGYMHLGGGYAKTEVSLRQSDGTKKNVEVRYFLADANLFSTLQMKMIQGRNFDINKKGDLTKTCIVNETFLRKFGWKNPIGRKIETEEARSVIGVVKDFHTESLYNEIKPLLILPTAENTGKISTVLVKIRPKHLQRTLKQVKTTWESLLPNHLYNGEFLDQRFAKAYQADQRRGTIFLIFSGLAIFIACIGLFGLASFNARQKVKEIGIRKVLGASVSQIIVLLSGGFVRLVLVSSLIAFPIAYYLMRQWLQNFAYRMNISWSVFVLTGLVTLLIALLTVSFQSVRAANLNPAEVLKDE